jgi:hypothetical protein
LKKSDWENSKNGYMVVYERVKKSLLKLITEELNNDVINITDENGYFVLSQFRLFENPTSLDCENAAVSRRDHTDIYEKVFNYTNMEEMYYYKPFYSMKNQIPYN